MWSPLVLLLIWIIPTYCEEEQIAFVDMKRIVLTSSEGKDEGESIHKYVLNFHSLSFLSRVGSLALSLVFFQETMREAYEAYVVYSFFKLMREFLGTHATTPKDRRLLNFCIEKSKNLPCK